MKNVPAKGPTVLGYDVSHWQSDLHVHAHMKQSGAKFCIIKADEGIRFHDKMFNAHWNEARRQGMIVGAYNFFHPNQEPITQAIDLLNIIGPMRPGMLGAVCDDEAGDGVPRSKHRDASYAFLMKCQQVLKKPSIEYGSPSFIKDNVGPDVRFKSFPLWVANYGKSVHLGPSVPDPWDTWMFWQFTDKGGLDLNYFNGSLDELVKLAA